MVKRMSILAAALLLAIAGPASAQDPGYTSDDAIVVSDTTVGPGESITVTARTFQAGSSVTFRLGTDVLGVVVANGEGVASITFDAPTTPGTYTVSAQGTGADGQPLTVTTTITVLGAGAGAGARGGGLPTTGSDRSISIAQVGLAALLGGGLLVMAANKRRASAAGGSPAGGRRGELLLDEHVHGAHQEP